MLLAQLSKRNASLFEVSPGCHAGRTPAAAHPCHNQRVYRSADLENALILKPVPGLKELPESCPKLSDPLINQPGFRYVSHPSHFAEFQSTTATKSKDCEVCRQAELFPLISGDYGPQFDGTTP
jgi:hypothetical protein